MSVPWRKCLVFGLLFVPMFAMCLAAYAVVLPTYQKLVLGSANAVLGGLDPVIDVEVTSDEGWNVFVRFDGDERRQLYQMRGRARHLIYMNLPLLTALVLAVPIAYRDRLRLLAIGLVLVFLVHVVSVVALTHTYIWVHENPDVAFYRLLRRPFAIGGQLFASVLWALLTWRYWLFEPATRCFPSRNSVRS